MSDAIAIYGAVIGTAAAIGVAWNIYHSVFRDKAHLRIYPSLSVMSGYAGAPTTCISVDVSNSGRRPITLSHFTLDLGDGRHLAYVPGRALEDPTVGPIIDESHRLPVRLEEGESHRFYVPIEAVQSAVNEDPTISVRGVIVTDGNGRPWSSAVPQGITNYFTTTDAAGVSNG